MDDSILSTMHRYVLDAGSCSICGQAEGYLTVASNGSLVHKRCASAVPGATYNLVNSYVCETKPVAVACMKERPTLEEGVSETLPHNETPSALTRTHIEFMLPLSLPPLSSGCICSICRHRKGRLVCCGYPGCTRMFHVSCARPNMCICMPSANGLFVRCLDHIPTSFRYDSVVNAVIPLVYLSAGMAVQDKIRQLKQTRDAWGRFCTRMRHQATETIQRLQNSNRDILRYYRRKIHYCTIRGERVMRCERSMLEPWIMKSAGVEICAEIKRSFTNEVLRWNSLRVQRADTPSETVDTLEPFNTTVYVTPMYRPPNVIAEEPLFTIPPYRTSALRLQRKPVVSVKRSLRSNDRLEDEKEKVRVVEEAVSGVTVAVAVETNQPESTVGELQGDGTALQGKEMEVEKKASNQSAEPTQPGEKATRRKTRAETKEMEANRVISPTVKKVIPPATKKTAEPQTDPKEVAAQQGKVTPTYDLPVEWEDWSSSPSIVSSAFEPDESDSEEKKKKEKKKEEKTKEASILGEKSHQRRERDKKERERRKEKREIQRALQRARTEKEREQRLEVKRKQREERKREKEREREEKRKQEEEKKRKQEEEKRKQEEEKRKQEEEKRKQEEEATLSQSQSSTIPLDSREPSHPENAQAESHGNVETRRSKGVLGAVVASITTTHI